MNNAGKNRLKSYIWNMIASAINAAEAVVVLMVITRRAGIEYAGYFSIGFTVANMLMCVGKFGVRNFQASDTENVFSFATYLKLRLFTMVGMYICTGTFLLFSYYGSHYSAEKILIVLLVTAIYSVEAFEDLYVSGLQHNGRLDIGMQMFSIRWIVTLTVWMTGIALTGKTVIPTLAALIVDIIVSVIWILGIKARALHQSDSKGTDKVAKLFKSCIPLFLSALFSLYLPNAAKYSIDRIMDDSTQAYYGFIAMPIFVIDVLTMIIFQPLLVDFAKYWNERNIVKIKSMLVRLAILLGGISLFILVVGYLFGIPVLEFVYGVDLNEYKIDFMILLLGGAALGFVGLFGMLLTVFRQQKITTISYAMASVVAILSFDFVVKKFEIRGATLETLCILMLLGITLFVFVCIFISKENRIKRINGNSDK